MTGETLELEDHTELSNDHHQDRFVDGYSSHSLPHLIHSQYSSGDFGQRITQNLGGNNI